jgi:class 3 adenylate cyclase
VLSEGTLVALERQPHSVAFEELGPVLMKGIPDPVRLYRASR